MTETNATTLDAGAVTLSSTNVLRNRELPQAFSKPWGGMAGEAKKFANKEAIHHIEMGMLGPGYPTIQSTGAETQKIPLADLQIYMGQESSAQLLSFLSTNPKEVVFIVHHQETETKEEAMTLRVGDGKEAKSILLSRAGTIKLTENGKDGDRALTAKFDNDNTLYEMKDERTLTGEVSVFNNHVMVTHKYDEKGFKETSVIMGSNYSNVGDEKTMTPPDESLLDLYQKEEAPIAV